MHLSTPDELSVSKNTSGSDRRLNDLHIAIYNLLQQWDRQNQNSCVILEKICQCRIQLMHAKGKTEGDLQRQMFISDNILRNSELLCASIAKFDLFLLRLRKFGPKLSALNELIASSSSPSELSKSSDDHQQLRIKELVSLFPIILRMYEQELAFKRDSIVDLALFDDQDLFAALVSAWKHEIYIEPAITSLIYPL